MRRYAFEVPVLCCFELEAGSEAEALAAAREHVAKFDGREIDIDPHAFTLKTAGVKPNDIKGDEHECPSCGKMLYNHPLSPPALDDNSDWAYEAKLHEPRCEWVATRGGRIVRIGEAPVLKNGDSIVLTTKVEIS